MADGTRVAEAYSLLYNKQGSFEENTGIFNNL